MKANTNIFTIKDLIHIFFIFAIESYQLLTEEFSNV